MRASRPQTVRSAQTTLSVTEARAPDGTFFGDQRLNDLIIRNLSVAPAGWILHELNTGQFRWGTCRRLLTARPYWSPRQARQPVTNRPVMARTNHHAATKPVCQPLGEPSRYFRLR